MYCPHCGKDLGSQEDGYCPNCGKKVNDIPSSTTPQPSPESINAQRKKKDNEQTLSVLSLLFGVLSIICGLGGGVFIFGGPTIGLIFGIIGLVFSKGRKEYENYAKVGKVCGIIGLVISIIVIVLTAILFGLGIYWAIEQGWQPF